VTSRCKSLDFEVDNAAAFRYFDNPYDIQIKFRVQYLRHIVVDFKRPDGI